MLNVMLVYIFLALCSLVALKSKGSCSWNALGTFNVTEKQQQTHHVT